MIKQKETFAASENHKKWKQTGLAAGVFAILLCVCLWFVWWIGRLAFHNTCIVLEEQYCYSEASDIVTEIETCIRFGKSIENYYGMEEILERLCSLIPGDTEAAVLDKEGTPVYTSFGGTGEKEREYTARLLSDSFQEKEGTGVAFGDRQSMVLPIRDYNQSELGRVVLIYDRTEFLPSEKNILPMMLVLLAVLTGAVTVFYAKEEKYSKRLVRMFPVIMVMLGLLVQISVLYLDYQKQYESLIYENAGQLSGHIKDQVSGLMEKGLPPEQLSSVSPYFEKKAADNDVIWNIRIVHSYMDTADQLGRVDQDTILNPVKSDGSLDALVTINRLFITGQMGKVTASFAVIFIICFMISYEVMKLIDILKLKRSEVLTSVSLNIKLVSFVTYTAIYASMPYAAVLMRTWKASVFGLSPEISASLPLTMELMGILLFSFLIPGMCRKMDIHALAAGAVTVLIVGNMGSAMAKTPYTLLFMRGICSFGFALFKYLMNSVVAAGSADHESVSRNFGLLNAGLLGGITVGGAVGAIVADAKGYQFNYFFTSILLLAVLIGTVKIIPWGYIRQRRAQAVEEAKSAGTRLGTILRDKEVLKLLILGDVPLNVGLMYVVAFLPVYMNYIGHSPVAVSYAYLINGLCGVYLGVFLLKILSPLPPKAGMVFAMLLGAVGILVLSLNRGLAIVFLSAGIMGLFDGYGTPRVTGYFAAMPQVEKFDTAQMLTVFNIVGSAVQIVCPVLYNLTIQENGKTGYLMVLGCSFAAVSACILIFMKGKGER